MPLTELDIVIRFATALICGGAIGLERELRNMPTGFRTMALVCLGSCVSIVAAVKFGGADEFSRVAQGIVTGIGFLGAGVIVQGANLRNVKGLTTAAAIWFTAAIGLLAGIGEWRSAFIATAMALCVLLFDVVISWLMPPSDKSNDAKLNDPAPNDANDA